MTNFRRLDRNPITDECGECCILRLDHNWNDWWEFRTKFTVGYVDRGGREYTLGVVKIGQKGLEPGTAQHYASPDVPISFERLDDKFFSIGDEGYYETLNGINPPCLKVTILQSLRDFAFDLSILESVSNEVVTRRSLLRDFSRDFVTGRLHHLSHGRTELTKFAFKYRSPNTPPFTSYELDFEVIPNSTPPTNIHIIIGRNGVGKTHCLQSMAASIVTPSRTSATVDMTSEGGSFSTVASVSFSAFDPFIPTQQPTEGTSHHYIGLKSLVTGDANMTTPDNAENPKPHMKIDSDEILQQFLDAVKPCLYGVRQERWKKALTSLSSDPVFADTGIAELETHPTQDALDKSSRIFERLSSGHKLVILILTRLVAVTQERTLVLLDEPEAHLHPPLVGSLIRSLSELLINRNGVAIVATHSPVVLQEVPRSCVYKMSRYGEDVQVDRPQIETFGESTSRLTSDVFGLEVTRSGFHQLLQKAANDYNTYEDAVAAFGGSLSSHAKALLRTFILEKNND